MKKYDLIVIGSGPGGEKAAVKAAYFLKKVALVEKGPLYGGGTTHFTIPSKILKEMASNPEYEKKNVFKEFIVKKKELMNHHSQMVHDNLINHKVDIYQGTASFVDANRIEVSHDSEKTIISGKNIIIAGGLKTLPPSDIPIDGKRVHVVETIMNLKEIPSSICIYGAGVIGCEYATMFAHLGSKVFLINERKTTLNRVDREIVEILLSSMKSDGIDLHFGAELKSITPPKREDDKVKISLSNGETVKADMFLMTAKRSSQLADLNFANAGIKTRDAGMIPINKYYQTSVPNIYAVGDVIGKPNLVNIAMDQGRYAVSHILKLDDMRHFSLSNMPQGIYTIPEISTVGLSEELAVNDGYDIVIGRAYYSDIARGIIMGSKHGMLKAVIDKKTQVILGVHIIGEQASELINFGVELVANQKTLNEMINANFNFPSLHELYKYAAFDGLSAITGRRMKKHSTLELVSINTTKR